MTEGEYEMMMKTSYLVQLAEGYRVDGEECAGQLPACGTTKTKRATHGDTNLGIKSLSSMLLPVGRAVAAKDRL